MNRPSSSPYIYSILITGTMKVENGKTEKTAQQYPKIDKERFIETKRRGKLCIKNTLTFPFCSWQLVLLISFIGKMKNFSKLPLPRLSPSAEISTLNTTLLHGTHCLVWLQCHFLLNDGREYHLVSSFENVLFSRIFFCFCFFCCSKSIYRLVNWRRAESAACLDISSTKFNII